MKKSANPKLTQVTLHLGRGSGGDPARPWRLAVEDKPSGTMLMEIEFSDLTFADLMSNRHTGEVGEAKVYSGEYVGLRHEHKNVTVPVPPARNYDKKSIAKALATMADQAEAANPGWIADRGEGWNQHRVADGMYRIDLRRWVEPK